MDTEIRLLGRPTLDVRADFERSRNILNHWLAHDGLPVSTVALPYALESLNRVIYRLQADRHRVGLETHETGLKRTTGGHNAAGEGGRRE